MNGQTRPESPTCACPGCNEPALPDGIYCPFCEDQHYHTHHHGETTSERSAADPGASNTTMQPSDAPRFSAYDTFRLARQVDDIPPMTVGVVLIVHGGNPCAYEVEFPDKQGRNLGRSMTYTVTEDDLIKVDDLNP